VTTDDQLASLSWCQAPIWGLRPNFYYCQTVAWLLMWGSVSDERTGLPFTITAGPRQRSHSWVLVPRDSWPYFTVSDSRLPQPGGPCPWVYIPVSAVFNITPRHGPNRKHSPSIVVEACLPRRCIATVSERTTYKTPFPCGRYLATAAVYEVIA
jgi:hypothetical protein